MFWIRQLLKIMPPPPAPGGGRGLPVRPAGRVRVEIRDVPKSYIITPTAHLKDDETKMHVDDCNPTQCNVWQLY